MLIEKKLPEIIKEVLSKRVPRVIEDEGSRYRHAAVLVPLFRVDDEYKILFTKRTNRVEAHKGQISFPGGAVDEEDNSFEETALREAHEEIGLLKEDVALLGRTDDARTLASNYIIHPIVGRIPCPYPFKINAVEVKRLVEVPLKVFLPASSRDEIIPVEYEGLTYQSLAYTYDGEVIWGATARIMQNLIEIIAEKMDLPVGGV